MQPDGTPQSDQPQSDSATPPLGISRLNGGVDPAALEAALNEQPPQGAAPQPATPQPAAPQPAGQEAPQPADPADLEEGEEEVEELSDEPIVTWQAHEYLHQEKGRTWYTIFAVVLGLSVIVTLWLQQWTFTAVLIVIAVVIVVNAKRPPRELTYSLSEEGLTVDGKLHEFNDFKSFGIIRDGEHFSVMLIPTQRFQPGLTVYFPEDSGEAIVDMLGARLPMKDLKLDAVDRVVRLLRL
jgi:hypothetical protein